MKTKKNTFQVDYARTPFMTTSQTGTWLNRLNWRCEILLTRNRHAIEGQRVLDLASHDGRFSWAALQLGARSAHGVEGRQHLVDNANKTFAELGYEPGRQFGFVKSDVFDYLARVEPGSIDTIMCLGFLYHTARHDEFLRQVKRIKPKFVIVDTEVDRMMGEKVAALKGSRAFAEADRMLAADGHSLTEFLEWCVGRSYAWVAQEDSGPEWMTTDEVGLVAHPSRSCLGIMLRAYFPTARQLDWHGAGITSWENIEGYRDSTRVSYIIELD